MRETPAPPLLVDVVPALLVAGLAGDVPYRRLRPSTERPWALRAWAAAVPAVLWLSYFAILSIPHGLGWSVDLWAGATVMSAISGFGLSLMVAPPAVPAAVASR